MEAVETYGIISLIPVAVVIITAIVTKRALEPLILGTLVGFLILDGSGFVISYIGALSAELGASAYFIIVFGLFGVYIQLLQRSGAIESFSELGLKFATNKKKTGVLTWVMGMVMFLDNYFSILGAGVSNRTIADKNKMSREFFTYAINMVACAICVLVPISLWGVFMSGTIDDLEILDITGLSAITNAIPFIFFAWVSIIMVLLYEFKIVPIFGPMKAAELRVETTGQVLPYEDLSEKQEVVDNRKGSIWNFVFPMVALIGLTLYTSELMYGLILGIVVCYIMYIAQKLIKPGDAFDLIFKGFEDMFAVTAIVISAFVLQQANNALGLAPYVVDSVAPIINAQLLPAIAFLLLLVLGFVTGSFWGMMAVCYPIILALAIGMEANIYLTVGAVIAGAAAGSSTCFYGDSVTLACGITGVKNIDYARTALPLIVPSIVITFIMYVIAGFIMA